MQKSTKRLFIYATVIIIVIFALVLPALIISGEPVSSEADRMNYTALVAANRKLQNEFEYITNSDNNNPKKIVFSSSEVNALLAMLVSGSRMFNADNGIFSDILLRFKLGLFYFSASKKTSFTTPYGRYINIKCSIMFDIENSDFKIEILSFKVGAISLPKFLIDYFLNQKQEYIRNIPLIQKLMHSVKNVHAYKDKLVIVYYPKNLRKAVYKLMHSIRQ